MPDREPRSAPAAVLDTNAVLDWLHFDDVRIRPLAGAIADGRVRWLVSPRMRQEFEAVALRLGVGRQPSPKPLAPTEPALPTLDRLSALVPDPDTPGPHGLKCRDPDDQVFLDLALACGADWLVTRDKALLELGSRARRLGLAIVVPDAMGAAALVLNAADDGTPESAVPT